VPNLLTIAIPTYNRARRLDRQLAWLDRSMTPSISDCCEVIVSDNDSPDDTAAVCDKWRQHAERRGLTFRTTRNSQNLGPIGNIVRCIEMSRTRFTWVIGDDDEIPDDGPAWVVGRLRADPDLASIVLNFRSIGKTTYDRCFNFDADRTDDGRAIISECLRQAYFGLAFMTAQVYRTEFAQAALRAWPEGSANYDYQVFVTAVTGLQGRVMVTRDPHVTYVTGDNIYEQNARVGMKLYADSLEVFERLYHAGFDGPLCRHLMRAHLWGLKKRFAQRALQTSPLLTLTTSMRALRYGARLSATSLGGRRRTTRSPHAASPDDRAVTTSRPS
jgi:glycosyltransferase involved in cell wall biosynthesis